LTLEETRINGETYVQQATLILDPSPEKLTVRYNSEWLGELKFKEVIELAAKYTLARMLERDDFRERYRSGTAISIHELLYPLAQAYDSVAVRSDIEIGGTDQTFNLLVGRDIQVQSGQRPQLILTMPLLVGTDGTEKMSKSLDNYVSLTEPPDIMFPKLMRVPDTLLADYIRLLTDLDVDAVMSLGPVEAHRVLARTLVDAYHGAAAVAVGEHRYNQVAQGEVPDTVTDRSIPRSSLSDEGAIGVLRLAVLAGVAPSNSEARRLVEGKGLRLDGQVVTDPKATVTLAASIVVQKGRNTFVRVSVQDA
jgi:tyrosyl-tRNA synthetase